MNSDPSRSKPRARWPAPVLGALGVLVFLTVWEVGPRAGVVDATYLPPFSDVAVEFVSLLGVADFWGATADTMRSWLIGLVLSLVAGIALGFAIGSSRFVRRYTSSTIEFLRPIPSVALIPIAIVLFSIRPSATVFVVVWACFWVILIHVIAGVADVDPVGDATARSYGLRWFRRARHVVWPTVLPYLMTGVRLSATIALVVAITIELVVSTPGIGDLIATNQSAGNVETVYALALVTGFLGVVINLAMRRLENAVLSWHPSVREEAA
ncbi:ABC transporter permease [Phytoactinopolyspora mesophila]|uniref:ABC transporter permease subunit n=1 Tax=Phytoactinopolyspora mesophila TaxID=2650750 RepID=A0A7K3LZP7_9ACTN|nr:ABC transporter permease [Phytoactinopolyspora mesophila]NDL56470.1 ABC transporter permease subunit [Phytoactinopolyspora mesophila]